MSPFDQSCPPFDQSTAGLPLSEASSRAAWTFYGLDLFILFVRRQPRPFRPRATFTSGAHDQRAPKCPNFQILAPVAEGSVKSHTSEPPSDFRIRFDRSVCFVQDLNYPINNQDLAYIYVMSHASIHPCLAGGRVGVISFRTERIFFSFCSDECSG